MDKTSNIVHFHNPNAESKHPHQIQSQTTSHTLKAEKQKEHPKLTPLKDWKPGDVEMFASMGFSHEKSGDEGYYMEEDILPAGDMEPQKFLRRISRTKNHEWVLEKKSNDKTDNQYKVEKVYKTLIGTDGNPGLFDYFDTLTHELTERLYLYPHMKLKAILESIPTKPSLPRQGQDFPVSQHAQSETPDPSSGLPVVNRGLSKEQKKMLQELVAEYNRYNEVLEARKNIVDVSNKMSNIGELAEAYLTEKLHEGNTDENAWFEEKTIRRNTSEIKKNCADFKKMASECEEKMRQMQTLYKECGMLLERYFDME